MKDSTISSAESLRAKFDIFLQEGAFRAGFACSIIQTGIFFGKPIDSTGKLCYNIYIKATRTPQTS